ncbi:hypothetical protein [Allobaculum sp. Allo2]|uniref:hypothetical protein n=1 Tax=Allobaculum sp. Allo2 TaxID=2853432 RepID=UPI001F60D1C9|nr:hypothetical protein [Allobaculum sp. Allo2]UNT93675.1 hypothetical protein KWG61_02665 [Allobaculum sp. Allo2]
MTADFLVNFHAGTQQFEMLVTEWRNAVIFRGRIRILPEFDVKGIFEVSRIRQNGVAYRDGVGEFNRMFQSVGGGAEFTGIGSGCCVFWNRNFYPDRLDARSGQRNGGIAIQDVRRFRTVGAVIGWNRTGSAAVAEEGTIIGFGRLDEIELYVFFGNFGRTGSA